MKYVVFFLSSLFLCTVAFGQDSQKALERLDAIKQERLNLAEELRKKLSVLDRHVQSELKRMEKLPDSEESKVQRKALFQDVNDRRREFRAETKKRLRELFQEEMDLRGKEIITEPVYASPSPVWEEPKKDFEDFMDAIPNEETSGRGEAPSRAVSGPTEKSLSPSGPKEKGKVDDSPASTSYLEDLIKFGQ